jgi:hypothetical protein
MARTGTQYRNGNLMVMAADELPLDLQPVMTGEGSPPLVLDGIEGQWLTEAAFPLIREHAKARMCVRAIVGWKPLPREDLPPE